MTKNLRVLSLIKGLDLGGAETLLENLSRAWQRRHIEHDVAYILPRRSALVSRLEDAGVRVYCLSTSGRDLDLRWALKLRRLLLKNQYDILHSHLKYPASIARLVARTIPQGTRPRLIYTEHNIWGKGVPISRIVNRVTFGLDDAQIAVSQMVAESIPVRRRRRVEVLVHGVRMDRIEEARSNRQSIRRQLGVSDIEVLIGTIANLLPQKGYEVLLTAARLLVEKDLPVRFVSVGFGPEHESIESMRTRLGLGDVFQLLGARSDALDIASGFDIFVLASHFEGFPVAVMEALALGLPTVSTRVGGVSSAIRSGREGLLVAPGNPGLLAAALERLVVESDTRARMAKEALERGRQFGIETAARRIEEIYREVLSVDQWSPRRESTEGD